MAVCNLFDSLRSASGNFLMFSQYVEDITRNYTEDNNWKVVPTQFVALDVDYANINKLRVLPNNEDLNVGVPKYFQNCFENACAYGREHYSDWASRTGGIRNTAWNPEVTRNLFWNAMFDGNFLNPVEYGETKIAKEIVYYGNINMHSYNNHKGMGYGEIYCYIPTDGAKKNCQISCLTDSDPAGRKSEIPPAKNLLEGHIDKYKENYKQEYFYNRDFSFAFDDKSIEHLLDSTAASYNINTIVVLYTVFKKENDSWTAVYSNIPMGMYIAGRFEGTKLTNPATKYNTTSYGTGTSYGLRICTRFSVAHSGAILKNTDIVADDTNQTNLTQLMTAMNENLSKMLDVTKAAQNTTHQYKDLLSIFKNNRTNVPYVRDINGIDYWFVNGKYVAAVGGETGASDCCNELAAETVQRRLDNIMDMDPNNDWSYIEDPNGCECFPYSNSELAEALGIEYNGPDYGGGTTGGSGSGGNGTCSCDFEIAKDEDIADIMESL